MLENGEVRFPLGERKSALARLPPDMHLHENDLLFDVAGGGNVEHDSQIDEAATPQEAPPDNVAQDHAELSAISGLPVVEGEPGTLSAWESGKWANFPKSGIGPIDYYRQPDLRGTAGWTDAGTLVGPHKGTSRPPNIDTEVWRRIHTTVEKRAPEVATYLASLREGSFVRPEDPGIGFRSGRAMDADLAAAPRAKRGKINIRRSANDKFAEIRQLPLQVIMLTDGPSKLWPDYVQGHMNQDETLHVFDLLSVDASEVMEKHQRAFAPGALVILAATQLTGQLQECRSQTVYP